VKKLGKGKLAKKKSVKRATKRSISAKREATKIPFIRQLRLTNEPASKVLIDSYVIGSMIGSRGGGPSFGIGS
jgi:hypothetical protein